jgi:hypothetical protein
MVCFQKGSVQNIDALGLTRKIEGRYSVQSLVFWDQIDMRGMGAILKSKKSMKMVKNSN